MRRHRRRRTGLMGKLTSDGGLTLTSMMDILTTLLFFVLKSYISGAEVTSPPPGVTLPRSTVDSGMRSSGERVATVSEAIASHQLMIASLGARLSEARAQMDDLDRRKGKAPSATHLATIEGDAQIEFRLLQKVMYTLDRSGFPDIALAVLKKA